LFFPAQAEYSYFSADFRLKIFLSIFLDYSLLHFRFVDFDGVEVILEPDVQAIKPDMTHITSWRNVVSIERTGRVVFVGFWLVLPFRERKNFMWFS